MTREEMVIALTRYELDWYLDNHKGCEDDTAKFFATGGFNKLTDEELKKQYRYISED